ncbi:MAG TPA: hypothetical protein VNN17_04160 [Terriglobia bacterium]|nr:hypothetical protein [Terriglobia bacterium]
MRMGAVLSVFALFLALGVPAHALDTQCVVVGPAASTLSQIAREAASAQRQADEIESYLWTNHSPDWRWVASSMNLLKENVRNLQKFIGSFERSEPRLTEAQTQQLERIKTGLATLTVFVNHTYTLIRDQQILPHRSSLLANAKAMSARAEIIRDAARNLRVVESA